MDFDTYHRDELKIALSADDPRRVMPTIPREYKHILDVGCGAGQTLIASHLSSDAVATGVDMDFVALQLGRELGPSLQFVCAAGERLPFKDDHFDFVISRVSLPYMHMPRALAEIARITKRDGVVWMALHPFSMVSTKLFSGLRRLELIDVLFQLYVIANGLAFHSTGKQFRFPFGSRRCESFQSTKGMRRALRAAGFVDVQVCRERHFVVTARKGAGNLH